jgi:hypothetical protein
LHKIDVEVKDAFGFPHTSTFSVPEKMQGSSNLRFIYATTVKSPKFREGRC